MIPSQVSRTATLSRSGYYRDTGSAYETLVHRPVEGVNFYQAPRRLGAPPSLKNIFTRHIFMAERII